VVPACLARATPQLPGSWPNSVWSWAHWGFRLADMCNKKRAPEFAVLARKWLAAWATEPNLNVTKFMGEGPWMERVAGQGSEVIRRQEPDCGGQLWARSCRDRAWSQQGWSLNHDLEQFQEMSWFRPHILYHENGALWLSGEWGHWAKELRGGRVRCDQNQANVRWRGRMMCMKIVQLNLLKLLWEGR
jgi:hypothetical protein